MEIFGVNHEIVLTAVWAGLGIGSIYALVAVGYNLIYRSTRVFNLAQGDVVSIGGLIAFSTVVSWAWPEPIALFAIAGLGALIGLGVDRVAVSPLTRRGGLGWVLTTLGMSVILRNVAELVWGPDFHRVPAFVDRAPFDLLGAPFRVDFMLTIVGAALMVSLLEVGDRRTIIGKAFVATAQNREAAQLRGINVNLLGTGAFALAGALGGIAGWLIAPITFAAFNSGVLLAFKGFIAIAIGGWGRHVGALVGGLLIGVTEAVAIVWVSAGYRDVIPLFVLAAVLFLKPQGIFGRPPERVI